MTVILVTVMGPAGRRDLSLPADVPIYELLPALLERAGPSGDGHDVAAWDLGAPGHEPFELATTLAACGVLDGAILHLSERRRPIEPEPEPPAPPPPPTEESVRDRTVRLLPPRVPWGTRVARAMRALTRAEGAEDDEPDARSTSLPRPADLATPQPLSGWQRAKRSWASTDYLEQLNVAINTPRLRRSATIAVVSPKGGVGKTTLSALMGTLIALIRRDRVVAVDTNPDFGSLGRILTPDHRLFVDDLLPILDQPDLSITAFDANLGRAVHGLMVIPAPTDPTRMAKLEEDAYTRVIRKLHEFVGVTVLDCGTGLQDPAVRAAIASADQLVLVTDAEPTTASLVAEAAQLLERSDRPIVLAVNKATERNRRLDLDQLAAWVPRATGMVEIPLHAGAAAQISAGSFNWRQAPLSWQLAARELVAVLLADWPRLGLTL